MFFIKFKTLGIFLILISFLCLIKVKIDILKDTINNNKVIENILIQGVSNKSKYVGYIQIDSVKIKRAIVYGINNQNLDNNDVAMEKNENIILAGHSIDNVFKNLHYLEVGEKIVLNIYNKIYTYNVVDKLAVFKDSNEKYDNDLILITCMVNPNKRLIILAEKNI